MRRPAQQGGIALVAVIFLIVVIAAALVTMARLSIRTTAQLNQRLVEARVDLAARSGLEWAIQTLIEDKNDCDASGGINGDSFTSADYPSIEVSLTCELTQYGRDTPGLRTELYRISATAEYGSQGDSEYGWQQLDIRVEL